jgi:hypothetical protein
MIHQATGCIASCSGSIDQEGQDCGNDSPSHHSSSHLGDADGGSKEDDDLNGKDAAALHDIFDPKVLYVLWLSSLSMWCDLFSASILVQSKTATCNIQQ